MGINAEDMYEMIKEKYPDTNISINDLKAYIFPSQRDLNKNQKFIKKRLFRKLCSLGCKKTS